MDNKQLADRLPDIRVLIFALLGCWVALSASEARGTTGDDVPVLYPNQEKVLYLPIRGDSLEVEAIRAREEQAITNFFRSKGGMSAPVVTSIESDEVYFQIEPALIMEAQAQLCATASGQSPSALLEEIRHNVEVQDLESAAKEVGILREVLPCSQERLSRTQTAEFFLYAGLTHPVPWGEEAAGMLRASLYAEPLISDAVRLGPEQRERLSREAKDLEALMVDVRLPQGDGSVFSSRNLTLDGRRVVVDRLFAAVPPGLHFLQVTLPNDLIWGTFIEIESGVQLGLVDLARKRFGLRERYAKQVEMALSEGTLTGALQQGLKVYTLRLQREVIHLCAVTVEEDQKTWITVRRFQVDSGLQSAQLAGLATPEGYTASVLLDLDGPWSFYTTGVYTGLFGLPGDDPRYLSHGGGLELELFRRLSPSFSVGFSLGIGARGYTLLDADGALQPIRYDFDPTAALFLNYGIKVGRSIVMPELGFGLHLIKLRGVPVYCSADDEASLLCTVASDSEEMLDTDPFVLNMRARAAGTLVRLSVFLPALGTRTVSLRPMARVGFGALNLALPARAEVALGIDYQGGDDSQTITAEVTDVADRPWRVYQVQAAIGLQGTY